MSPTTPCCLPSPPSPSLSEPKPEALSRRQPRLMVSPSFTEATHPDQRIKRRSRAIFGDSDDELYGEFVRVPSRCTSPCLPPMTADLAPDVQSESLQRALDFAMSDYLGVPRPVVDWSPSQPEVSSDDEADGADEDDALFYSALNVSTFGPDDLLPAINPVNVDRALGPHDLGNVPPPLFGVDRQKVEECLLPLVTSITCFAQQLWEHPFFRKELHEALGQGEKYAIVGYLLGHHDLPQGVLPWVGHVLSDTLIPFFSWVVENRYRSYCKQVRGLEASPEVRFELLNIGKEYWDGGDEMALVERFYDVAPKLTVMDRRKLGRARGSLFERNQERSWQRLGENLDLVREAVNITFRLIMRELDERVRFGLDAVTPGDPFEENQEITERLLLKSPYARGSLGDLIYTLANAAVATFQKHFGPAYFSSRLDEEYQQIGGGNNLMTPLVDDAEVVSQMASDLTGVVIRIIAQFATNLMENFCQSIANNNFATVVNDLIACLHHHVLTFFRVRDAALDRSEGKAVHLLETLRTLRLVRDLHPYVPASLDKKLAHDSDEAYFREQVFPKIKRMLCKEKSLFSELLKVILPESNNGSAANEGKNRSTVKEIISSGLDHLMESMVLPMFVEGLNKTLEPSNLNQQIVAHYEQAFFDAMHNGETDKLRKRAQKAWLAYSKDKKKYQGATPAHLRMQARLAIQHGMEFSIETNIPGLRALQVATALQLHEMAQATPVLKHILYHLIDALLRNMDVITGRMESDTLDKIITQPPAGSQAIDNFPPSSLDAIAEMMLDLLKVGSHHLPANTPYLGIGAINLGKGIAWLDRKLILSQLRKNLKGELPNSLEFNFPSILHRILSGVHGWLNGEEGFLERYFRGEEE